MKFGEFMLKRRVPKWRFHYIDYHKLTEYIESDACTERIFWQMLSDERSKVDSFVKGKVMNPVVGTRTIYFSDLRASIFDQLADSHHIRCRCPRL